MVRGAILLLLCSLLGASAFAQSANEPLDAALRQALAEQAAADREAQRLEQSAAKARTEADRLHAEQAAAAQAIEAAEARISAANARVDLASAFVAAHRQQLLSEQQPVSSLLAGLATMARRPPLLVLADEGGTDELVKVRLLLEATLPVIRNRTARLSAELANGQRLREQALAARRELAQSREGLVASQRRFASLEEKAVQQALASGSEALGVSDVSIAAGEDVERLRGEQADSQSIRAVAAQLVREEAAPASPFRPEGGKLQAPFPYELPVGAAVIEGLGSVDGSGVRARGMTLATTRGMRVAAPAAGTIRFAGPFHDYDGVVVIDHGGGWLSLIVNIASPLHPGDKVGLGDEIGRAIGPLQVELSQNGRRISPALIAGSSQNLSNATKAD